MKRIIALVISFWVSNVVAGTTGLPLTVGGDSYLIELIENTALVDGASAQLGQDVGDHYYGVIASVRIVGHVYQKSMVNGRAWSQYMGRCILSRSPWKKACMLRRPPVLQHLRTP